MPTDARIWFHSGGVPEFTLRTGSTVIATEITPIPVENTEHLSVIPLPYVAVPRAPLQPGTTYYYRVGDGTTWSAVLPLYWASRAYPVQLAMLVAT